MKVYIVISGDCSGYSIERVFLDKAKAEKWAKYNNGRYYNKTEVKEFDTYDENLFYAVTKVFTWVSRFNGKIKNGCFIEHMSSDEVNEKPDIRYRVDPTAYEVDNELAMVSILSDNKLNEEELEKKYTKICYDLLGQIDNLILNESWTVEMVNEWLKDKYNN